MTLDGAIHLAVQDNGEILALSGAEWGEDTPASLRPIQSFDARRRKKIGSCGILQFRVQAILPETFPNPGTGFPQFVLEADYFGPSDVLRPGRSVRAGAGANLIAIIPRSDG